MENVEALKRKIVTAFKLSGFLVRSDNCQYLAEQLMQLPDGNYEKWLTVITEHIQGQRLETPHIDRVVLDRTLSEINRVGLQEGETIFSVIDAFSIPRYYYNSQNKKFEVDNGARQLLANPSMKSGYMRQRYAMLLQKALRHELFKPAIIEHANNEDQVKKFKLLYTENLLSSSCVEDAVVLGLLTQLTEGKFYIEDPTGSVELNLRHVRYHSGFFCEGCFVLAEGSYSNGVLKVDGLGFPPAETAASSRAMFGTQNSWGGPSTKLLKYSTRLQEIERTNVDATMVVLSDVRLDMPIVMSKLRQLFVGYDSCPPVAIVLMGSFSTSTQNQYDLRQHLTALGALAEGCNQLKKQTDLILVPSCDDASAANVLPRPPLPSTLAAGLKKAWPRTVLTTNPCRLQYCSQQITVCRLDLMAKFCRNTLHFPADTENIEQHYARTLICQGHLTPIHPIAMPVHWDYDAALWLYPLPDLIIMGDSSQSFTTTQHGCTVLNTGSFVKSKFAFKVYIPATGTVEDSEIPDDMEVE